MNTAIKKSAVAMLTLAVLVGSGLSLGLATPAKAVSNCPVPNIVVTNDKNFIANTIHTDAYGTIGRFYVYNYTQCTFNITTLRFSLNTITNQPLIQNIRVYNDVTGAQFGSVLPAPMPGPAHMMSFTSGGAATGITLAPGMAAWLDVKATVRSTAPTGPNIFAVQFYQVAGQNLTLPGPFQLFYPVSLPMVISNWFTII